MVNRTKHNKVINIIQYHKLTFIHRDIWAQERVYRGCGELLVLLGDSEVCLLTHFSSYPNHLLSHLFGKAARELRMGKKTQKNKDIFRLNIYFWVLRLF